VARGLEGRLFEKSGNGWGKLLSTHTYLGNWAMEYFWICLRKLVVTKWANNG